MKRVYESYDSTIDSISKSLASKTKKFRLINRELVETFDFDQGMFERLNKMKDELKADIEADTLLLYLNLYRDALNKRFIIRVLVMILVWAAIAYPLWLTGSIVFWIFTLLVIIGVVADYLSTTEQVSEATQAFNLYKRGSEKREI